MNNNTLLNRIIINPKMNPGKPVIKGTRLTVQHILELLAQGMTISDIINEYKNVTKEDILACLFFATQALDNTFLPLNIE